VWGKRVKAQRALGWGGEVTDKVDFERVDVAGRILMIWILKK
jgi:hypothetical protein